MAKRRAKSRSEKRRYIRQIINKLLAGKIVRVDVRRTYPALIPYLRELERKGYVVMTAREFNARWIAIGLNWKIVVSDIEDFGRFS